jgi:hypothetical protein
MLNPIKNELLYKKAKLLEDTCRYRTGNAKRTYFYLQEKAPSNFLLHNCEPLNDDEKTDKLSEAVRIYSKLENNLQFRNRKDLLYRLARSNYSLAYYNTSQFEKNNFLRSAYRFIDECIEINKNSSNHLFLHGLCCLRLQKNSNAIASFDKAASVEFKELYPIQHHKESFIDQNLLIKARLYTFNEDYEYAISTYERYIGVQRQFKLGETYDQESKIGQMLLLKNDLIRAGNHFQKSLKNIDLVDANLNGWKVINNLHLGDICYLKGDNKKAKSFYLTANSVVNLDGYLSNKVEDLATKWRLEHFGSSDFSANLKLKTSNHLKESTNHRLNNTNIRLW